MSIKNHYFTRLTPNFYNWEKPSGADGKCGVNDSNSALYEAHNHFGWEEWLFEDYFKFKGDPNKECFGFIEAFNDKNKKIDFIERLYLYTKICNNNQSIEPGCYYVGYIDNVKRLKSPLPKTQNQVCQDLKTVGINHDNYIPMLKKAKNISFKVGDVKFFFDKENLNSINLHRVQYRFGLYNLETHTNFLSQNNIK
jgi:hypothetical protein